jgi:hypothetical protein
MLALAGWKASHALQGSPVFDGGVTPEQGQALYAAVKAGDVVMYSAVWCGTCQNTKAWMQQNNITFTERDMEPARHALASTRAWAVAARQPFCCAARPCSQDLARRSSSRC